MSTYGQMSDEAVVKYALEGKQSGKSDQQKEEIYSYSELYR